MSLQIKKFAQKLTISDEIAFQQENRLKRSGNAKPE